MFGIDDAITAVSGVVTNVIDRIWPDPTVNAQMKEELAKAQLDGSLKEYLAQTDLIKSQIEVNKVEAANPKLFIAGWRPFIGWAGGVGFAVQFAIIPIVGYGYSLFGNVAPPPLHLDPLLTDILFGILGLNIGARTYEKKLGVVNDH